MKFILAFCLLLSTVCSGYAMTVTAPSLNGYTGQVMTLPITADDATGVVAYQFNINYDPAVMTPFGQNFGCSVENTAAENLSVTCNVVPGQEGLLRIAAYGAYPMQSGGTVLNLSFTAVAAGETKVAFSDGYFFSNFGTVPTDYVNGLVSVETRIPVCTTLRCRPLRMPVRRP